MFNSMMISLQQPLSKLEAMLRKNYEDKIAIMDSIMSQGGDDDMFDADMAQMKL